VVVIIMMLMLMLLLSQGSRSGAFGIIIRPTTVTTMMPSS